MERAEGPGIRRGPRGAGGGDRCARRAVHGRQGDLGHEDAREPSPGGARINLAFVLLANVTGYCLPVKHLTPGDHQNFAGSVEQIRLVYNYDPAVHVVQGNK